LARDRFERILHSTVGYNIPFVNELFQEFDTSGDGLVDFREFSFGLSLLTRASAEDKLKLCFSIFDTNKDGFIQREELTLIMGTNFKILFGDNKLDAARQFVHFAFTFDKNKDGKLSFEEFKEAILKHPIIVQFFALNDVALKSDYSRE